MTSFKELQVAAERAWRLHGPGEGEKLTDRHMEDIAYERACILTQVDARLGAARWFVISFAQPIAWAEPDGKPRTPLTAPGVWASCWEDAVLRWSVWPQTHGIPILGVTRTTEGVTEWGWDDVFAEVAA